MENNTVRCDVLLLGYEDEENLGMRYIAAFLNKYGVKTGIESYNNSSNDTILQRIQAESPKMVGFSLIFQRMLFDFAELMAYLRQKGVKSHFTIGGHFPSMEFKETLKLIPELDTVVRHEGEQTMLDLYRHLDEPDKWSQLKGLAYRSNGDIKATPPRPLIENLDSIPFPLRGDEFRMHMGLGMASVLASRGCYYDCSFCSIRQFYNDAPGTMRRSRSPSNVVNEMEDLFESGVRIFNFRDDNFSMKGPSQQRWMKEFAKELEKKRLSRYIIWRIACRIDEIDEDICSRLKDVGLTFLYLGLESGSDQGLNVFNKHYTVKDIHHALDVIDKVGIEFEYGFMLLEPDTTFQSLKDNLAFFRILGKDGRVSIHFTKMLPYAGTPISRRLKKEGRLKGTISSPDYSYKDQRIDLMEIFLRKSFQDMLFKDGSLLDKLQFAQFNSVILDKFFWYMDDTSNYIKTVKSLTEWCNKTTLETMNSAIKFMENRSYDDIIKEWDVLKSLAEKEIHIQSKIELELDYLNSMGTY